MSPPPLPPELHRPAGMSLGRVLVDRPLVDRPMWQRLLWLAAGVLALAAFCFSRASTRCERWLVEHPRFGPLVRNWRASRAIPLRAKQLAWTMMAGGSLWAAWVLPARWAWLPALSCAAVALWLWRLPTGGATCADQKL